MKKIMKSGVVVVAASFLLTGCLAAQVIPGVLALGTSGYSFYQISKDASADFDVKESKPSLDNSRKIKNLKSLAIYPLGKDGAIADAASSVLDMKIVSPTKTIGWVTTNALPMESLPKSERIQTLAKMARAVGGDASLYIKLGSAEADIGISTYVGLMDVSANMPINYYLVHKNSGLLWSEEAVLKVSGSNVNEDQLVAVLIDAVSNRIMDIRLDREMKQKKSKNWTAVFECGGKLNFTCKDNPSTESQTDSAISNQDQAKTELKKKLVITKSLVKKTQTKLNKLGFNVGAADGVIGNKTIQALKEFQSLNSLSASGKINRETLDALSIDTDN